MAGALIALLLATAPALADTPMGTSGMVGHHYLRDSSSQAGVTCNFNNALSVLSGIRVRPPVVFAADRDSAKRDMRRVGWRFIVQRHGANGWTRVYRSTIQKATAYDDQQAPFSARSASLSYSAERLHRVVIKIFWYRPDGSKEGTSTRLVDWYHYTKAGANYDVHMSYCGFR